MYRKAWALISNDWNCATILSKLYASEISLLCLNLQRWARAHSTCSSVKISFESLKTCSFLCEGISQWIYCYSITHRMVFFSKLSIAGIDVYIIIVNKTKQLQFKVKRKSTLCTWRTYWHCKWLQMMLSKYCDHQWLQW